MRHGLFIEPLDVLFFRDARPFDASTHAASGLPFPQTVAGAVRTALLSRTGFDFRAFANARRTCSKTGQESQIALKEALRVSGGADNRVVETTFFGPWPALQSNGEPIPLFAQPLDLLSRKDPPGFVHLKPGTLAGWKDGDGLLPLTRREETDAKASSSLFSLPALRKYLANKEVEDADLFKIKEIYDFDNRTGIAVDADRLVTAEGMIYGIRFLSLKPGNGIYAEIETDFSREEVDAFLNGPIPFGGEGRYASVKVHKAIDWPLPMAKKKTKWLLVTPAFLPFSKQTNRPLPEVPGLKAAISDAGKAVSGWDMAKNGPRETRFAIPPGAVYFFDGEGPTKGFLGGTAEEQAEGWGFALPGTWEE